MSETFIHENHSFKWPPSYTIKKHKLARHVKLRTSIHQGLVITVPVRFNIKDVPAIIEKHKPWILKQFDQIKLQIVSQTLPDHISLPMLEERWNIQYIASQSKKIELFCRPNEEIVLVGKIEQQTICRKLLISWLKDKSKKNLVNLLHLLSAKTQLHFQNVFIRNQKTRWGSCSANKTISLNYKLIFLPQPLAQHVLIHELCHTRFLNHSNKFWDLVAKHDHDWKKHKKMLKQAEQLVPGWVL